MRKSLISFDTDHIKGYVFGTDKLKEIRGASSILDNLNRVEMVEIAKQFSPSFPPIYANGGSGMFVVEADKAEAFGQRVQQEYHKRTGGGASITYAIQKLPDNLPDDRDYIMQAKLHEELELIRYRLVEQKGCSLDYMALPSHPFLRPCDSCGIQYAEVYKSDPDDVDTYQYYCTSCKGKQDEDEQVKKLISKSLKDRSHPQGRLWGRIIQCLDKVGYDTTPRNGISPERPNDFNEFSLFSESKNYLGLIYADGNNMGIAIERLQTLQEYKEFSEGVDKAIHEAMSLAIKKHLPVYVPPDGKKTPLFPFDILLLGGDDVVMVTGAAKAMDVALTIAQEFRRITREKHGQEHTLSVGVVLAPIKYPFSLLQEMAKNSLDFAKKTSAETRKSGGPTVDDTRINFMIVTGGSPSKFKDVYESVYHKIDESQKPSDGKDIEFRATLRPYDPANLEFLLKAIREGHRLNLGRTKLHQMREAILKKNLTTSVSDSLAVLRNWRETQRNYIAGQVYAFGGNQILDTNLRDPRNGFPRVIFPWFASKEQKAGRDVYCTSLLDFVELYDFVSREEDSDEN